MRNLTSKQRWALRTGVPDYVFVDVDHPDDRVRAWSGNRPLVQYVPEGEDILWHGAGEILEIRGMEFTRDFAVTEVELIFSGIANAVVGNISRDVTGRRAVVSLGFVTAERHLVDGLIPLDILTMDRTELDIGADTARFIIYANSGLTNLDKPSRETISTEFQKARYPNVEDTGFDLLPELQDFESSTKWSPGTMRSA